MADRNDPARSKQRVAAGLVAGTNVETDAGQRPVEKLRPGQKIKTLRGGLRRLKAVYRTKHKDDIRDVYPEGLLLVPEGALGNEEPLYLLPDQHIGIDGQAAEALTGLPMVLVAATRVAGFEGIEAALPVDGVEIHSLIFDEEDIVFAGEGLMVHCPRPGRTIDDVSDTFPVVGPDAAEYLMSVRTFGPLDDYAETEAREAALA